MGLLGVVLPLCILGIVLCNPLDVHNTHLGQGDVAVRPRLWKRFINPSFTLGQFTDSGLPRMRTRRGAEADECEKLQLCKLHAESNRNFLSAFELYFVNKENARQWDHHTHRLAECDRLYGDCNSGQHTAHAPAVAAQKQAYEFVEEDYE